MVGHSDAAYAAASEYASDKANRSECARRNCSTSTRCLRHRPVTNVMSHRVERQVAPVFFPRDGEWRVVCSFVCVFAGRVPLRLPVAHALILGRIDVALCDPPGHRPRLEGSTGRSGGGCGPHKPAE